MSQLRGAGRQTFRFESQLIKVKSPAHEGGKITAIGVDQIRSIVQNAGFSQGYGRDMARRSSSEIDPLGKEGVQLEAQYPHCCVYFIVPTNNIAA